MGWKIILFHHSSEAPWSPSQATHRGWERVTLTFSNTWENQSATCCNCFDPFCRTNKKLKTVFRICHFLPNAREHTCFRLDGHPAVMLCEALWCQKHIEAKEDDGKRDTAAEWKPTLKWWPVEREWGANRGGSWFTFWCVFFRWDRCDGFSRCVPLGRVHMTLNLNLTAATASKNNFKNKNPDYLSKLHWFYTSKSQ